MKCKKCGHRAKDINGMRKHYMKAHPGAMKHHGPRKRHKTMYSKGEPGWLYEQLSPEGKRGMDSVLQEIFGGR